MTDTTKNTNWTRLKNFGKNKLNYQINVQHSHKGTALT